MLDGTMPVAPRARFGLADVRDLADLHMRAMATPDAAGKRYLAVADGPTISFLEVADILRRELGSLGARSYRGGAGGRSAAADHPQQRRSRRAWMASAPGQHCDA
jgi:nucleoside-diphosphate-sugar epimerase